MQRNRRDRLLIALPGIGLALAFYLILSVSDSATQAAPTFKGEYVSPVVNATLARNDRDASSGRVLAFGNAPRDAAEPEEVAVPEPSPRAQVFELAIVGPDGNPIPNAEVTWIARPAFTIATAESLDITPPLTAEDLVADEEGRLALPREIGVIYELVVKAGANYPAKRFRLIDPGFKRIKVEAAFSITGNIFDEQGGTVANASVELWHDLDRREVTTSDVNGRYSFPSVVQGEVVTLRVLSANHQREVRNFRVSGEHGTVDWQNFNLRRGGRLQVEVVDFEGNPISDAKVRLIELNAGLTVAENYADGNGIAVFESLMPRRQYMIEAESLEFGLGRKRLTQAVVVHGDGSLDALTERVQVLSTWSLRGTVTMVGRGRLPVGGARVVFESQSDGVFLSSSRHRPPIVETDGNGNFLATGLIKGAHYTALVYHRDFAMGFERGIDEATYGQPGARFDYQMENGHRLEGQVLDEDGQPIPNASVFVTLLDDFDFGPALGKDIVITTDDQGYYVIDQFLVGQTLQIGAVDRGRSAIIRGKSVELTKDFVFLRIHPVLK
ncbi:MAG: carboxypeptidase-like regulatory domain-containing protein [Planctomycetota bacterium]